MRAGPRSTARSFYGYKNHINADARHKLIRRYGVSDASVHDSQKLDGLLSKSNTSVEVYADSAYRSAATEARLKARGFREPHPCPRGAQSTAVTGAGSGQPKEEQDPRSHRARIRGAGECAGRADRAHDRTGSGAGEDRPRQPRLQYPPPRDAGANGRRLNANNPERVDKTERVGKISGLESGHQLENGGRPRAENICSAESNDKTN